MDEDDVRERKQQLRRSVRAARTDVYGDEDGTRRREDEAARLLAHADPLLARVRDAVAASPGRPPLVAAFHPTSTEADVMPLARALAALGAQLIFPAASGRELEWITWDGTSEFLPSPGRGFGREPDGRRLGAAALADVVLVLAPAVAVDRSGTRIGHGAGYYDRALRHAAPSTPVVAVVHPQELLEADRIPREAGDVPIGTVLTADGLVTLVTPDGRRPPDRPRRP